MALSPIRYAVGYLNWQHIYASKDSQFGNPLMRLEEETVIENFGIALNQNFTCDGTDSIHDRWLGLAWVKPVSFHCSTTQLYLLGLMLRFLSCLSLLALTKIKSNGGGSLFEGRGQSFKSEVFIPLLNLCFWAFLIVVLNFSVNCLLMSH